MVKIKGQGYGGRGERRGNYKMRKAEFILFERDQI